MRTGKGSRDFLNLAAAFRRAKVDGGTDRHRAEVKCLLNGSKRCLVVQRRQRERFVVVNLHQKRDFVRVLRATLARTP